MARILAIRFSALGDIAMTVPILKSVARRYPDDEVTLLSRSFVAPLLADAPKNLHFVGVNLKDYSGLLGIWRLFKAVGSDFDCVADLHNVLRSRILSFFYKIKGVHVATLVKDRDGRRALVTAPTAEKRPLKSQTEAYMDVFARLQRPIEYAEACPKRTEPLPPLPEKMRKDWPADGRAVGIAPFAQHKGKIYPEALMEQVVASLTERGWRVFLFGGGAREKDICESWGTRYGNVVSTVGKNKMDEEVALMAHLRAMLTMDSANMHLAALVGTPVVSLWGATHPYAGFAGWQAKGSRCMGADMDCRPCSVFGNKPCAKSNTYECLNRIAPEEVVTAVIDVATTAGGTTE